MGSAWVTKRQVEYVLGRQAAHGAVRALRRTPTPILWGAMRQPLWPPGLVGSISHADFVAVAIAARKQLYGAIGVDLEFIQHNMSRLAHHICTPSEQIWAGASDARLVQVFSAKEALYKALSQFPWFAGGFLDWNLVWNSRLIGFYCLSPCPRYLLCQIVARRVVRSKSVGGSARARP